MERLIYPKLRKSEAPLLHAWLELPAEHEDIVGELNEPSAVLELLRERELWPQAMRLLAYGLPEREAVWWSCMCIRHTAGELAGAERSVVEAAEDWVRRQDGTTRHAAEMAMRAAAFAVPGAWCGLGVAWAGREPFHPRICTGRPASRAVEEALARGQPEAARRRRRFVAFYESGVDIAAAGAGRLPPEAAGRRKA